jgi:hypothetical protein
MNTPPSSRHGGPNVAVHFLQALLELNEVDRQSVLSEALSIWCPECGKSHAICSCEADAYNALGAAEDEIPASNVAASTVQAPSPSPGAPGAPGAPPVGFQPNPHAAAGEAVDEDDMSIDMNAFHSVTRGAR